VWAKRLNSDDSVSRVTGCLRMPRRSLPGYTHHPIAFSHPSLPLVNLAIGCIIADKRGRSATVHRIYISVQSTKLRITPASVDDLCSHDAISQKPVGIYSLRPCPRRVTCPPGIYERKIYWRAN